jgi:uncharacterized protein
MGLGLFHCRAFSEKSNIRPSSGRDVCYHRGSAMKLHLVNPSVRYLIRSARADCVCIGADAHTQSLIVAAQYLLDDWRPRTLGELQDDDWLPVLALEPELVLLGSGARHRFPPATALAALHRRGIPVEVMDTAAAGRTFNILLAEDRKVVAALLIAPLTGAS